MSLKLGNLEIRYLSFQLLENLLGIYFLCESMRKCSFLSRSPVKISEVKEAVPMLKYLQS